MSDTVIFWHRRDLRLSDNVGLYAARHTTPKVVGLFCLDPYLLEADDVAPARVAYMIGCIRELGQEYQKAGGNLLIVKGNPLQIIPQVAQALNARGVYWNLDVEPYSQTRDKQVEAALQQQGIATHTYWDQLLHYPQQIVTQTAQPYTVYTPFWKNWIKQDKAKPVEKVDNLQTLTHEEMEKVDAIPLPTVKDLGYVWDNPLLLTPGEKAAYQKLEEFCSNNIEAYGQQRDYPAYDGTSQLSAALKFGAIGIRRVWQATVDTATNTRSDESKQSIEVWQKELAWREFYQHCMYFFPQLAQGAYRPQFQNFPWEDNEEYFQAWCEGKTGYPIVDAAMRQLKETGWMHNRCRMIVASFLTKDLIINWQWGEKYFMQQLYDGDLSANNGGWQWSASSGMDTQPLRIFNPTTQTQKFDPEGEYIRQWVPELRSLESEYLVSGKISPLERSSCDYPMPIVDHNEQQKKFKLKYQQVKQDGSDT